MIVKVHARGAGGGSGPTGYLLGRDGQRELAVTLRGDPSEVRELIDSTKFARKYTSGVLSFAEADLKPEQKEKIMDSFEAALLPGMDKNQFSVLWVEHRDKGRLELNFVIPNVELITGKRLQPYYHGADCRRVNAWAETVRYENKLADPNEPKRRRALTTPSDLPKNKQKAARVITDALLSAAAGGSIKDRSDVVRALTDAGFTVARETKSSISIKDPSGGQNLRLKGTLYERDFAVSKDLRGELEQANREYQKGAFDRFMDARTELKRGIEIKRDYLDKRYPREPEAFEKHSVKQLEMDNNNLGVTGFDRSSDPRGYGLDDKRKYHANQRTEGDFSAARDPRNPVDRADRGREKGSLFNTPEGSQDGRTVHVRKTANSTNNKGKLKDEKSRETRASAVIVGFRSRRDTQHPLSVMRSRLELFEEKFEGRGLRHGEKSGEIFVNGDALRVLQLFDERSHLSLRATRANRERGNISDEQRDRTRLAERIRDIAGRAKEATGAFYSNCKRLAGAAGDVERAKQNTGEAGKQLERISAGFAQEVESLTPVAIRQILPEAQPTRGYSRGDMDRGGGGMSM